MCLVEFVPHEEQEDVNLAESMCLMEALVFAQSRSLFIKNDLL